jgi:endonuclease G
VGKVKISFTMKSIRSFVYAAMYAVAVVSCTPKVISLKSESIHLALGNPSGASVNPATSDNYLLLKPQYALSYNRSKGHANWVAWELSQKWLGTIDRQNDFKPDDSLPSVWNKITPNAYSNSGFDRGHLCPSADRTQSAADNSATFLMTNMVPQAPELNREAWAYLEEFCRDLVSEKHKLYIIAGTYGSGGEGSKGNETKLKNTVNVPASPPILLREEALTQSI